MRQIYGLTLAVLVLVMIAAGLTYLFEFPMLEETFSSTSETPRIVALSAIGCVVMASLVFGAPRAGEVLRAVVVWGLLGLVLVGGYTYRTELVAGGYRILGALAPGMTVPQTDGTVAVMRDASGHFQLEALVNDNKVRFLVDTGASAVVLTERDAEASGIDPASLSYSVPVSTANGRTMVAPVNLAQVRIGSISLSNVRGFVARPGSLETSLLGMSALSRLSGWQVEGERLVLKP